MNRAEMEEIAEDAAAKALQSFFLTLGVDASDAKDVKSLQDDLRHVRKWRLATESAQAHTMKTVIGVIVTGALGWLALVLFKPQ